MSWESSATPVQASTSPGEGTVWRKGTSAISSGTPAHLSLPCLLAELHLTPNPSLACPQSSPRRQGHGLLYGSQCPSEGLGKGWSFWMSLCEHGMAMPQAQARAEGSRRSAAQRRHSHSVTRPCSSSPQPAGQPLCPEKVDCAVPVLENSKGS